LTSRRRRHHQKARANVSKRGVTFEEAAVYNGTVMKIAKP
jgi:uncharacterized DUF497 family protein